MGNPSRNKLLLYGELLGRIHIPSQPHRHPCNSPSAHGTIYKEGIYFVFVVLCGWDGVGNSSSCHWVCALEEFGASWCAHCVCGVSGDNVWGVEVECECETETETETATETETETATETNEC